jgi:hypothetical protein
MAVWPWRADDDAELRKRLLEGPVSAPEPVAKPRDVPSQSEQPRSDAGTDSAQSSRPSSLGGSDGVTDGAEAKALVETPASSLSPRELAEHLTSEWQAGQHVYMPVDSWHCKQLLVALFAGLHASNTWAFVAFIADNRQLCQQLVPTCVYMAEEWLDLLMATGSVPFFQS